MSMTCNSKKHAHAYCDGNEQQHRHEHPSRNITSLFSHVYPSHHLGHVQTSWNYGDVEVLSESSCDDQLLLNRISLNPEEGRPIGLCLRKSTSLIKQLQSTLTQEKQQDNHQEVLSELSPAGKLKASNFPALLLKIGSWIWASKNEGDLVVKFYYGKKKLVWEFLYGCRKRKIEIRWSQVSAINAYVDKDKQERLEIELNEPPEFFKEIKFQPRRHTQWATTEDFTGGQAHGCRQHILLFSPGVLDGPFKKLLQYDNHLYNLSMQPFPSHKTMEFSYNKNVYECPSSPLSNYEHHGTVLPFAHNLSQTNSPFIPHSGCNIPTAGMKLSNVGESATRVSCMQQKTSVVWEQSENNQTQDVFLASLQEKDHYQPYQGLAESWTKDQQLEWQMDIHNVTEFTNEQNCNEVDSTCQPFTQYHENSSNPSGNWMFDGNHHEGRNDDSSTSGSVMNHMAYHDDEICSFNEQQINDLLVFLEDH